MFGIEKRPYILQMRIYLFLKVLLIIILIALVIAFILRPRCGNGKLEVGENTDSCCLDAGCIADQTCTEDNRCRDPNCGDCQYLQDHTCKDYDICSAKDCREDESYQDHECISLECGPCQHISNNSCQDYTCCSSTDCDDLIPSTFDSCNFPGTLRSGCVNIVPLDCYADRDCDEKKECMDGECVDKVQLELVSLRDNLYSILTDEQKKIPNKIYDIKAFTDIKSRAATVGIDINDMMDEKHFVGSNGDYFFDIFFDMKRSKDCPKDYLIQRVRVFRQFFDQNGNLNSENEVKYLVEAWRLGDDKKTIAADQHWRHYRIEQDSRRTFRIDIEVGCGRIPRVIEVQEWPYEEDVHHLIEGYDEDLGHYEDVIFDFSTKYKVYGEFDKDGKYSVGIDRFNISVKN